MVKGLGDEVSRGLGANDWELQVGTTLAKIAAPGGDTNLGTALTFTAGSPILSVRFNADGSDLIIVQNTDAGAAHHVTVRSGLDQPYQRYGHIVSQAVVANGLVVLGPFPVAAWEQSDGLIYVEVDDSHLQVAVIQLS